METFLAKHTGKMEGGAKRSVSREAESLANHKSHIQSFFRSD